jgi:hypothetical protein
MEELTAIKSIRDAGLKVLAVINIDGITKNT